MIAILFLVVFIGSANFLYLLPPVINWDEGTHAIWGFREWLALKDGNLSAFWHISRDQFAYPPLGSWLIAFINLPFEFSLNLTRFVSTVGFILGGVLLYLLIDILLSGNTTRAQNFSPASEQNDHLKIDTAKNLYPRRFYQKLLTLILNSKYLILFLYLSSPAILFYSVTVFKESWGATLTLLVFYFYFQALSQKTARAYFCVSLGLVLLFFEKYNYAILVILTLGLEAVVELILLGGLGRLGWFGKIKKLLIKQTGIFLPILVFASWWILTPTNKWQWFLDIMRSDWNPVTVGIGDKWQYLLFFIQSIRTSYTFSNVLFLLILIGLFRAIGDIGVKKVRILLVFFIFNFVLGTIHWYNLQDRYIYTSIPILFLLVGYGWSKILVKLTGPASARVARSYFDPGEAGQKTWTTLALSPVTLFLVLTLFVLRDLLLFPSYLKANATHMLSSPMYNESDYHDTLLIYDYEKWPKLAYSKKLIANSETSEGVIDYILDKTDINKPVEIVGYTAEISPDWVELRRAMRRREELKNLRIKELKNYNKFLVAIEVRMTSRLYTYDYKRANAWQLGKIAEIERSYKDNKIEEKDFKELGVKVRIYGLM